MPILTGAALIWLVFFLACFLAASRVPPEKRRDLLARALLVPMVVGALAAAVAWRFPIADIGVNPMGPGRPVPAPHGGSLFNLMGVFVVAMAVPLGGILWTGILVRHYQR